MLLEIGPSKKLLGGCTHTKSTAGALVNEKNSKTARKLDINLAIKRITQMIREITYPTGLRGIGAVAEHPHYENHWCPHDHDGEQE